MQFNQDPSAWGPGMWLSIHLSAFRGDSGNQQDRKMFVEHMLNNVAPYLPCLKCREHCRDYITKRDPITRLSNDKTPNACSIWAWRFHNNVNDRLGKTYKPSLEEVLTYISDLEKGKGCENCTVKAPLTSIPQHGKEERKIRRQTID